MAIDLLGETPIPPAAKRLVDSHFYRVRVGNYRIIYTVDNGQLIVQLIQIAHRREAYRNI
jgi:mRNA interferase RelE/StbE